jgi:hypothetical protein
VKDQHTGGDLQGDYANRTEFILYAHKGRRALEGRRGDNVLTDCCLRRRQVGFV